MDNFDYIKYLKNNKLLTEIKVNDPVEVFNKIKNGEEIDEIKVNNPTINFPIEIESQEHWNRIYPQLSKKYKWADGEEIDEFFSGCHDFPQTIDLIPGEGIYIDDVGIDDEDEENDELDESNKPKEGDSNPLGSHTEREPNNKLSSNLKNKSEKIAKLAKNHGFALDFDIQDLLPEERVDWIIKTLSDNEIEEHYYDWFGKDLKENIKNIVRKTLEEMSTSGGGTAGASFTPGVGEQYATKYAFKKKNKNGKYTSK